MKLWINGKEIPGAEIVGFDFQPTVPAVSTIQFTALRDVSGSFSGRLSPQGVAWFYRLSRKPLRPQRPGPKHHPRRRRGR